MDHTRRWQPADGGYISTYSSGPPGLTVVVSKHALGIQITGVKPQFNVDEARWLSARLAEAAGINEVMRGVQHNVDDPLNGQRRFLSSVEI